MTSDKCFQNKSNRWVYNMHLKDISSMSNWLTDSENRFKRWYKIEARAYRSQCRSEPQALEPEDNGKKKKKTSLFFFPFLSINHQLRFGKNKPAIDSVSCENIQALHAVSPHCFSDVCPPSCSSPGILTSTLFWPNQTVILFLSDLDASSLSYY